MYAVQQALNACAKVGNLSLARLLARELRGTE